MKRLRNAVRVAVLLGLAAVTLLGCALFQTGSPKDCPRVSLLNEAAKMTEYKDGPGRDLTDVLFEARVLDIKTTCSYAKNYVRVVAAIDLAAQRGPAFTVGGANVPFFVAIIDKAQNIMAKKEFQSEIRFSATNRRAGVREEIEQTVFLKDNESGTDYEIIVGLQLNERQLQQNRGQGY
ncbi:MAG: hypothetical protein O2967_10575 [Proteobacteria bacterium]|nr:hypothetical protein [Pseudomonadota bacterium]